MNEPDDDAEILRVSIKTERLPLSKKVFP